MATHKLWVISTYSGFVSVENIALPAFLLSVDNTCTHLASPHLGLVWATVISTLINVVISKIKRGGKQPFCGARFASGHHDGPWWTVTGCGQGFWLRQPFIFTKIHILLRLSLYLSLSLCKPTITKPSNLPSVFLILLHFHSKSFLFT